MAEETANLSRSAGIISFASAISRVTGLLNIIAVAYALGWGRLQDSYNLANVMPNMLFELIAGGILTSLFIPIFVEHRLKSEADGARTANNITTIMLVFLVAMATLGTIFSYYFVRLQTFLVPPQKISVAELNFFFKFFVWEIVFYGLTAILNGILQANRRFTAPAFAPIFNNITAIATIFFFYLPLRDTNPRAALVTLAIGTTLGVAAMALVQLPALLRLNFKYRFVFDLRDPAFKRMLVLAGPVFAYVAGNQIGLTVSNALAWKFDGGMSAFTIAWRFFQMPYGLLAVSISTVLFPSLSEQAAGANMDDFKRTLLLATRTTAFIIIPASVVFFFLSGPIISLVFLGSLGRQGVDQTAYVMAYFMLGLLPFSTYALLTRVFYALQDTRTPMIINTIGVPFNIGLNFLLVGYFNVAGLSMGHSLTYLLTMVLLFLTLRKRIGPLSGRSILEGYLKFSLISGAMAGIMVLLIWWATALGESGKLYEIALISFTALIGTGFYIVVNKLTGTGEVRFLSGMVRGIFKGSKRQVEDSHGKFKS